MRTGQKLRNLIHTALFTINDELHYRSFYILTIISVLFVIMLRGCFSSDMFVNGQRVDSVTMGWHASLWAFHLISAAGVLIAVLLSMRVFRRDRENGMAVSVLSKPVSRIQYVSGKITGIFCSHTALHLSCIFRFTLLCFLIPAAVLPGFFRHR